MIDPPTKNFMQKAGKSIGKPYPSSEIEDVKVGFF
jgi:hypothetical protein